MLYVTRVTRVTRFSFIHNHIVSPSNVANNSPKRRARGFIMVTNTQSTTVATLSATDALAALKAAEARGYAFRGTGNGIGFEDGEEIRSFEGIGFPTWEDDKDDKKGTYIVVSFNGKKIAINSFIKEKFLLNNKGELTSWKGEGGFVEFISGHPIRPDMTETELLATINAYINEGNRLVAAHAKFSAIYGTSVQGGFAHRVGKYNIIG